MNIFLVQVIACMPTALRLLFWKPGLRQRETPLSSPKVKPCWVGSRTGWVAMLESEVHPSACQADVVVINRASRLYDHCRLTEFQSISTRLEGFLWVMWFPPSPTNIDSCQ